MVEQETKMSVMGITRYSNEQSKRITKACIETALIQLLEEKEIDKISITELVKRAGVSRTAFYAHYETKEDVLKSALGETIERIDHLAVGDPRQESYWESLFKETSKVAAPFRLLLKAGLGDQILSEISEKIVAAVPKDSLYRYNEFLWVGAIYNVLTHWVLEKQPKSPEEMAKLCVKIIHFEVN